MAKIQKENQKYRIGFIAIFFPIFYAILDGLGTFADALLLDTGFVNEDSANIAYEYTFFIMAVICYIYVYVIIIIKVNIIIKTFFNYWTYPKFSMWI